MVDALVSIALENLKTILSSELSLLFGITNELQKLSSTFTALQAVLEDAETNRVKEKSVEDWLDKLRDVAYDVDDILDEWRIKALKFEVDENGDAHFSSKKVCKSFSPVLCLSNILQRHKIANRIKEVRERLDVIADEKNKLYLKVDHGERRHEIEERQTSSQVDESTVFGRDLDKDYIIKMLISEQENNKLPLISIVGMGGLGKTTLAQLVYNDERVKSHFEKRLWVCVSDDFDPQRLTRAIIESAMGNSCSRLDLDPLQHNLCEILRGKQFLLVLDDIWNEDSEKWDKLALPLVTGARGSRIVVTTRSEKVSITVDAYHMHNLAVLSDDDCWALFSHRALLAQRENCLELEKMGREIIKKCKGVPLAAKAIGSSMRFKRTRREWLLVVESETWDLQEVEQGILPALLLSYYNLPSHLKRCFAYCSIFPKDYSIKKDMLIKLWMAQGFIISRGRRDIEEVGEEYFEDLLRHSFFQDVVKDDIGNIIQCKMHDLVHDLAKFVAKSECSYVEIANLEIDHIKALHSSLIVGHDVTSLPIHLYALKKLRTLQLLGRSNISMVPHDLFHHLRYLRALDLSRNLIAKLPRSVGKLKHIRYLDLSYTIIEELPESVCSLYNLQTLKLQGCYKLCRLPRGMRNMVSLRHLEINGTTLNSMPKGIGSLLSLRTLCHFNLLLEVRMDVR